MKKLPPKLWPRKEEDRMPRGAIVTVAVGLVLTLGVLALDWRGGGSSAEIDWAQTEQVETPAPVDVGENGSFEMRKVTLAAIPPNGGGELIFRLAGNVVVSSGSQPTSARCDVVAPDAETTITRTRKRRAAYPRPSEELQAQEVPELLELKFNAVGNDILGIPIRDVLRRYTTTPNTATVDWDGFDPEMHAQNWVWELPDGSGAGAATLSFAIVYKTAVEPEVNLKCQADVDGEVVEQRLTASMPIPQEELEVDSEAAAESTEDVE